MRFTLEIEIGDEDTDIELKFIADALAITAREFSYARIYKDIRLAVGETKTIDRLGEKVELVTVGKWEIQS
jgi:hypothetical protein